MQADDNVVIRMPIHGYNKEMKAQYELGQTRGQKNLIYYMDMILQGYLSPEAFEKGKLDDSSWEKLKVIFKRLENGG